MPSPRRPYPRCPSPYALIALLGVLSACGGGISPKADQSTERDPTWGDTPTPTDSGGVDTGDPLPAADWALVASDTKSALMSIHGRGPDDVYAVGADDGSGGLILHYDGSSWSRVTNGDKHDLWWVETFADGTAIAAGSGGTILRDKGDGAGFVRDVTPGLGSQTIYGVWGSGSDDLWAVGGFAGRWGFLWHWDGESWTNQELPDGLPLSADGELPALFKVWGRAADDVWVVGGNGTILHYDGAAWSVIDGGTDQLLFTVHGNADEVVIVGPETVLVGGLDGFTNQVPEGAGILQGACTEPDGGVLVSGQSGTLWVLSVEGEWEQQVNTFGVSPESLHATWVDPTGGRWSVGGSVLSGALDQGIVVHQGELASTYTRPADPDPIPASCSADDIDPDPSGSMARRWNEQLLNAIRRDIPRPVVHARNLFHTSAAMWDAWAVYDDTADPYLGEPRVTVADPGTLEADRDVAISYAAYRVLTHRYTGQIGGETSVACFNAFMDSLGLDPDDAHTDGEADDPIALGNRIGQAYIDAFADDGSNEANNYADTTAWVSPNAPLVVDNPGNVMVEPSQFQLLNLANAETQNGIVLESGNQKYIGAQWGLVTPFALGDHTGTYGYIDPGGEPLASDPEMAEWVLDVLRKNALLDPNLDGTLDISPGAYGNNSLGQNDGAGHSLNPVTGLAYAPNVVKTGDFGRVLAEFWADGPASETPPGHWNTIANYVSDEADQDTLGEAAFGAPMDRLAWDLHLYFAMNGALHDAAITSWGLKREYTASRPISLIRWMASQGQRSDPTLPSYSPDGLPLEAGVTELITAESSAPGERHHNLRVFQGEVAVKMWLGEPGDRTNQTTGTGWARAKEWFPYQRRTFVTPAFPGYTSGHSTFSRSAAEVLTLLTGSAYFPGGLGEFDAPAGTYLVFEDGPSETITLQWATFQDAADQAGQSRIYGGIHIFPDDQYGREAGYTVGHMAVDESSAWFDGTAIAD